MKYGGSARHAVITSLGSSSSSFTESLPGPKSSLHATHFNHHSHHESESHDSEATISEVEDYDLATITSSPDFPVPDRCMYLDTELNTRGERSEECDLNSPPRRVVSHFFGRNKKETRAIPDWVWCNYCRQHYQRSKYRLKEPHDYARIQMALVEKTIYNLQRWGGVDDFEVALRKRKVSQIGLEDRIAGMTEEQRHCVPRSQVPRTPCNERWMLPYLGKNKTFGEVLQLIRLVVQKCDELQSEAPEFEIVPAIKPHLMGHREWTVSSATIANTPLRRGFKPTAKLARPSGITKRPNAGTAVGCKSACSARRQSHTAGDEKATVLQ